MKGEISVLSYERVLNAKLVACSTVGIMGNYPGEASSFGPARGVAAAETAAVSSVGAHISFSPSVTYSLAPGACVPALQGECLSHWLSVGPLSYHHTSAPRYQVMVDLHTVLITTYP